MKLLMSILAVAIAATWIVLRLLKRRRIRRRLSSSNALSHSAKPSGDGVVDAVDRSAESADCTSGVAPHSGARSASARENGGDEQSTASLPEVPHSVERSIEPGKSIACSTLGDGSLEVASETEVVPEEDRKAIDRNELAVHETNDGAAAIGALEAWQPVSETPNVAATTGNQPADTALEPEVSQGSDNGQESEPSGSAFIVAPTTTIVSEDEPRAQVGEEKPTASEQQSTASDLHQQLTDIEEESLAVDPPTAPKFRPNVPREPKIRIDRKVRGTSDGNRKDRAREIRVYARLDRTGGATFGLLFERYEESPDDLEINVEGAAGRLETFDDDWYELVSAGNIGDRIANGLACSIVTSSRRRIDWILSACRNVYIFAPVSGHSVLMHAPRLSIGRRQLVLYRNELASEVSSLIAAAASVGEFALPTISNTPTGWSAIGTVIPIQAIEHQPNDDELNLLRPLPDIDISLEGGICLQSSEWLEGFPPRITVTGLLREGDNVSIDGLLASKDDAGTFATEHCNEIGEHTVWCAGSTARYRITPAPISWPIWECNPQRHGFVCGGLVQPFEPNLVVTTLRVPKAGSFLVGSKPGQIAYCEDRAAGEWAGYLPFKPVWQVPADPYHCNKNETRIRLLQWAAVEIPPNRQKQAALRNVRRWCAALLDCRRRGINLESAADRDCWNGYVNAARRIYRSIR